MFWMSIRRKLWSSSGYLGSELGSFPPGSALCPCPSLLIVGCEASPLRDVLPPPSLFTLPGANPPLLSAYLVSPDYGTTVLNQTYLYRAQQRTVR